MIIARQKEEYENYQPKILYPADFNDYWLEGIMDSEDSRMKTERVDIANPFGIYENMTLWQKGGEITARVIRPAEKGSFPTVFFFHDLGRGIRGWQHMMRFLALNYAVVAMDNHLPSYAIVTEHSFSDLERCYRNALLLVRQMKVKDYVDEERLIFWGEGFGGSLAVAAASFEGEKAHCAVHNPVLADCRRIFAEAGKEYPKTGDYLDLVNFAKSLKGNFLLGTGLMDDVADVRAQYALYHAVIGKKRHLTYPKYGHERNNFFENEFLRFC